MLRSPTPAGGRLGSPQPSANTSTKTLSLRRQAEITIRLAALCGTALATASPAIAYVATSTAAGSSPNSSTDMVHFDVIVSVAQLAQGGGGQAQLVQDRQPKPVYDRPDVSDGLTQAVLQLAGAAGKGLLAGGVEAPSERDRFGVRCQQVQVRQRHAGRRVTADAPPLVR